MQEFRIRSGNFTNAYRCISITELNNVIKGHVLRALRLVPNFDGTRFHPILI